MQKYYTLTKFIKQHNLKVA